MMQIYRFSTSAGLSAVEPKAAEKMYKKKPGFLWIDLENPGADELRFLNKILGFRPETFEVILEPNQPPVIETDEDAFICSLWAPSQAAGEQVYTLKPVVFLVGSAFIITIRYQAYHWIQAVRNSLEKNPKDISDEPLMLFIRAVRRIVKDVRSIMNSWENSMSDFIIDELESIESVSLVRLLKMKAAAEELYKHLLDGSEVFKGVADSPVIKKAHGGAETSVKYCSYAWESLIEQLFLLIQQAELSLESFRILTLKKQRRTLRLLLRTALISAPIIIALFLLLLIMPEAASNDFNSVIYPVAALVFGAAVGAGLAALLKE